MQSQTLPAVPALAPFPQWTSISTRNGDPGASRHYHQTAHAQPSCLQLGSSHLDACLTLTVPHGKLRVCYADVGVKSLPTKPWELSAHDITPLLGPADLALHIER